MSKWSYGLVQTTIEVSPKEKYKQLVLCEVYFDKQDRPFGITYMDWKDIKKKDIPLILEDLKGQMSNKKYHFKEDLFK